MQNGELRRIVKVRNELGDLRTETWMQMKREKDRQTDRQYNWREEEWNAEGCCMQRWLSIRMQKMHHQMRMDFENSRGFSTHTQCPNQTTCTIQLVRDDSTPFFCCYFSSPLSSVMIYCLLLSTPANGMAIQVCWSVLSHSTHYSPTLHFATLQFSILFSVNSATASVLHCCIATFRK